MLFQFKLINHITQLTFIKTHPSSVIVPYCHQPIRMQALDAILDGVREGRHFGTAEKSFLIIGKIKPVIV